MSIPRLFQIASPTRPGSWGFEPVGGLGAAHRASLGRGLAFALLLAATSLASAFVPVMLGGPDWVVATNPAVPSR